MYLMYKPNTRGIWENGEWTSVDSPSIDASNIPPDRILRLDNVFTTYFLYRVTDPGASVRCAP